MTSEAIFSLVQHFLPTRVSDPDTARCEITRTQRLWRGAPLHKDYGIGPFNG